MTDLQLKSSVSEELSGAIDETKKSARFSQVLQSIRQFMSVSELLRFLGAAGVVASMSLYLLQGWYEVNDVQRYLKLLAQTGLLTACGFLLVFALKDNKGARLFFGLSLTSVPANFTVLAALLWSVVQWDVASASYPESIRWVLPDSVSVGMLVVSAVALLAPLSYLGFRLLVQGRPGQYAIGFLLSNLMILTPVRSALASGLLVLLSVLPALAVLRGVRREGAMALTPGERFAALILFAPVAILVARSLFVYEPDQALAVVLSAGAYVLLRQGAKAVIGLAWLRALLELLSLPVTLVFVAASHFLADAWLPQSLEPMLAVLMLGAYVVDLNRWSVIGAGRLVGSVGAAICMVAISLLPLIVHGQLPYIVTGFFNGVVIAGLGLFCTNRIVQALGAGTLVVATATGFDQLVDVLFTGNWLVLGGMGIAAIVVAALLERYGPMMRVRISRWNGTENS